MLGKTKLAKQGGPRLLAWHSSVLAAMALAAGLAAGGVQAQRNNPPNVSLAASPSTINVGGTSVLTATASDPGGAVVKVVFYNGPTQVAQVSSPPYTYSFSPALAGTYTLRAVAIDNQLAQATSAPVMVTVNTVGGGGNKPPVVSLSSTATTVKIGASTQVTANATDADGSIARVTFYENGAAVGIAINAPYNYYFQPTATGSYTLKAVATDDKDAETTSNSIVISAVNGGTSRNNPPTVSLSATSTSIGIGASTTLNATAADSDGNVTKVDFYNGATLLSTDPTSPYSATFSSATAGTFTLTARATDNSANQAVSNAVSVVVTAAPPVASLPRITLSLSNTLFAPGATVTLTGNASATAAGASVSKVAFFMNGAKLVDDTTSPYSTTVTLPSAGNYDIYAQVTDSLNQTASTLPQRAVVKTAPAIVTSDPDIWRLLNQATFGASQEEAARVKQLGIAGWINDQINQPVSGYPDARYNRIQLGTTADCTTSMPGGGNYPNDSPEAMCVRDHLTLAMLQRDFFTNALSAPDQLRQRVAWALSQIVVTSGNENDLSYAHVMSRYQSIMFQEAFGNYETLLRKVTYNPAMGNYLDMVNNDRAPAPPTTSTRVPNENYAREIMQLFSINLVELNQDGSPLLDAQNKPIPTYGQTEIGEFAKVFTGYTYSSAANPGGPATGKQGRYYGAPMVPYPTTNTAGHDPNEKTLLSGTVLPAGQTAQTDIDAAVRNVFMHPNTPVYVGRQLIQRLVTGNPSPGYVSRVAGVFINNGSGVRGDMAAVVKAILLDSEARGPAKGASDFGSLREPVLMVTGLLRALSGVTDGSRLEGQTSNLGQRPFYSPTVFNYFMPDSKVPGTAILGPEFGIHTTVTAVGRANLVYALVYGGYNADTTIPYSTGTRLFLAPFEAIADNPAAMVSLVNQTLAGGQFPASLEPTIATAVNAITLSTPPTPAQLTARARMAVYLMASSYDYQVQR